MIISAGGNDFLKYPYAAVSTGSGKIAARYRALAFYSGWVVGTISSLKQQGCTAQQPGEWGVTIPGDVPEPWGCGSGHGGGGLGLGISEIFSNRNDSVIL